MSDKPQYQIRIVDGSYRVYLRDDDDLPIASFRTMDAAVGHWCLSHKRQSEAAAEIERLRRERDDDPNFMAQRRAVGHLAATIAIHHRALTLWAEGNNTTLAPDGIVHGMLTMACEDPIAKKAIEMIIREWKEINGRDPILPAGMLVDSTPASPQP